MNFDTGYPADSVEFCPAQGLEHLFVCGTYNLLEGEPPETGTDLESESDSEDSPKAASFHRRIGKCILFKITEEQDVEKLKVLQELDMPAILDMKWSPSSSRLAIADSEGRVSLHQLGSKEQLHQTQAIQCRPAETLCLSLDWSNRRNTNEVGRIAVSCSDGSLLLLRPDNSGVFSEQLAWHAHDFEAWITAWDYWNMNTIYSGGDDLKFKGWDVRQGVSSPTFVNTRFEAGVTSIQCHPHKEHVLAVGSYDATVRIFDMRMPLVPTAQAEVGGGAWRVKWHPSAARSTDLLVACMHDGFKVIRFSPSIVTLENATHEKEQDWEIAKRFDAHQSLAYGADWTRRMNEAAAETLIASCSFYDHILYTWKG